MTTTDFTQMFKELPADHTEVDSKRYDDYAEHSIDVSGSRADLLELIENLNDYELELGERDIQENGMYDLLRFTVYENF